MSKPFMPIKIFKNYIAMSTAPAAGADANPALDGYQLGYAVLGARPLGVAALAGIGFYLVGGGSGAEAMLKGCVVGVCDSAGDAVASVAGVKTRLSAYLPESTDYDFVDGIMTAVIALPAFYYAFGAGVDQATGITVAISAGAAILGPKFSTQLLKMAGSKSTVGMDYAR